MYIRHSEPSTRLHAVSYIAVLAVAREDLRLRLLVLGGTRATRHVQDLVFRESQEGWEIAFDPTAFCLRSLEEPSPLLSSVDPSCLDTEHPSFAAADFFQTLQDYHFYLEDPVVEAGLTKLVEVSRCVWLSLYERQCFDSHIVLRVFLAQSL